jgi:hypothetical protein
MGANCYFNDSDHEKYLLYSVYSGKEQIHGEYADLKSLSAATTWIAKYPRTKYKIKKVSVKIQEVDMTEEEFNYIKNMASKKGIELTNEKDLLPFEPGEDDILSYTE